MREYVGRPGLGRMTLAWLAVLLPVGAGFAGMPPLFSAGPAAPPLFPAACSTRVPVPEPADLTPLARISADKAMAAALSAYPGARVKALALENEDGCLVYRLLLSNGLEVKVDAGNGRVLRSEPEDEGEEHEAGQPQRRKGR